MKVGTHMAEIHRLECANRTDVGGVLIVFDSKSAVELSWTRNAPVLDTLQGAKDLAAQTIDKLMQQGASDYVERTNWTSVTAAYKKHLDDWNEKRKAALYALPIPPAVPANGQ